jgi:hypothetical protein
MFNKMLEKGVFPDHVMFISIARFLPKGWDEFVFVRSALKAVAKLYFSGELLRTFFPGQWLLKHEFAAGGRAPP